MPFRALFLRRRDCCDCDPSGLPANKSHVTFNQRLK
jgi:hypothetical protein